MKHTLTESRSVLISLTELLALFPLLKLLTLFDLNSSGVD